MTQISTEDVSTWSAEELRAEIAQVSIDFRAVRILEKAAEARHARERTRETEAAYEGRRREAARVHARYMQLVKELDRRSASLTDRTLLAR
jgi:outer membrane murein-binding lipoprotein Lpp